MKAARLSSVCECQARLYAEIDEDRHVIRGWAKDMRRQSELPAPANAIHVQGKRFDVGWFCPFCIRNTLRSFSLNGLSFRPVSEPVSPPA